MGSTSGDLGTINEVPVELVNQMGDLDELVNQMSDLEIRLSQEDLSPEEQGEISIKLQELAEQMDGASTSGDFGTINEVPDELVNQMSELKNRLSQEDLSPEEQGEIPIKLQELAEQMGGASTSGDLGTINEVPVELVN